MERLYETWANEWGKFLKDYVLITEAGFVHEPWKLFDLSDHNWIEIRPMEILQQGISIGFSYYGNDRETHYLVCRNSVRRSGEVGRNCQKIRQLRRLISWQND